MDKYRILIFLFFWLIYMVLYAQPFGNSLVFNGSTDFVSIPDNANLNQTSTITVEAWVKPCDAQANNLILAKSWCGGYNQNAYHFAIRFGKLRWTWDNDGCGNGSSVYESSTALIQSNQWQHIAAVHTTTGVSLYVNGALIAGSLISGSYSGIQTTSEPMRLGVYKDISSNYWGFYNGRIDEVRVWNYAVPDSLIAARYNATLTGTETGLVAYYPMDNNGAGTSLAILNQATMTGSLINGSVVGTATTPFLLSNSLPLISVNLGPDTTLCYGNHLLLDAGQTGASYIWQDNSTASTFLVTQPGIYWVEVSQGGCANTDTIVIDFANLDVDIGNDTSICQGDSIDLNAYHPGATYLWDNGATSSVRTVSQADTFWVQLSLGACQATDTIVVDYVTFPNFSLGNDTVLCAGAQYILTAGGTSASILWFNGSTSNSVVVNQSGSYWAIANRNGCSVSDTVEVFFKPLPSVDLGNDTILCDSNTIKLDANVSGAEYLWSTGSQNSNITVQQQGHYWVRVTVEGCSSNDTILVHHKYTPEVNLGSDTLICEGQSVTLFAGGSYLNYLWSTGASGSSIEVSDQGLYWVSTFNDCGIGSDSVMLYTEDCDHTIFIPNVFTPYSRDGFNDYFFVKGTNIAEYRIIIFNRWGEQIYESNDINKAWDGYYKGKLCPSSVYYYRIDYRPQYAGRQYIRQGSITLL